jgi:hypothetical protein
MLIGTYRKDQDRKPTLITGLGLDTTPPQFLSKMQALEWQTLLSVLDERILIEAHQDDKGHRHRLSCFWFLMHSLACFFSFFLVGIFLV